MMGNQPFYMRRLCVITESKTQNMHPPIMLTNAGYRNGTLYYVSSHTHTTPPSTPTLENHHSSSQKALSAGCVSLIYGIKKQALHNLISSLFVLLYYMKHCLELFDDMRLIPSNLQ